MKNKNIYWIKGINIFLILSLFLTYPLRSFAQIPGEGLNIPQGWPDVGTKPALKSFSTSGTVGEIPIETSVTPSGAFVATVPIRIVPGIAGMQPALSLNYSSQSGNGIAGYGWNLSGVSCISRRGLNYFQDGKTAPTVMDEANGEFLLDGKRLIFEKTESVNGVNKRKYYLDGSSKTCVVYEYVENRAAGYKFRILEVNYPNGQKGIYQGSVSDYVWPITQLSDRHGNYMSYTYNTVNGTPYISSISYGGNTVKASGHYATVGFTYESRSDKERKFDGGMAVNSDQRLKYISNLLGIYTLNYNNSYYSLLNSVSYTAGSQSLNPLTFTYGAGSSPAALTTVASGKLETYFPSNFRAITGKFNYAGFKEGLVTYPHRDAYVWKKPADFPYEGFHSGYHKDDEVIIVPEMGNTLKKTQVWKVGEGFRDVVTMDVDGNPNTEEVVMINANGTFNQSQTLKFTILTHNQLEMGYDQRVKNYSFPSNNIYNGYSTAYPMSFFSGDFNGDGIQELCAVRSKDGFSGYNLYKSGIYLFDLKSQSQASDSYSFKEIPFVIEPQDVVLTADYDGDGKTDLFHFGASGTYVYSFEKDASSANSTAFNIKKLAEMTDIRREHFTWERNENAVLQKHRILLGDINGDGKTDILMSAAAGLTSRGGRSLEPGSMWIQCLSKGTGGFEISKSDAGWINTYSHVFMHDFNGDGRSDIVSIEGNTLWVWYSNGSNVSSFAKKSYPLGSLVPEGKLLTVGINHTNHNRVLVHISGGTYTKLSVSGNERANSFLTTINNSMGVETKVTYARTDEFTGSPSNLSNTCSFQTTQQFPYATYKGCLWVAREKRTTYAGTDYSKVLYRYTDPVIQQQGLGFCGFKQVYAVDNVSGKSRTSNYDPLQYGILKDEYTDEGIVENEYNVSLTAKKEITVRLKKQTQTNNVTGVKTVTDRTYDDYGNVLTHNVAYGSDVTEKTTNTYTNVITANMNLIGLPKSSQTTRARGYNSFVSSSDYIYNAAYLPQTVTEKVNSSTAMVRSLVYDQSSNIIQKTSTPFNNPQRATTVTYIYTTNGRYMHKETDAIGTFVYLYGQDGQVISRKDYRNLETKFEFDPFGKPIKTTGPDGTVKTLTYAWQTNSPGRYYVTESVTGQPTAETYYDVLGRAVRTAVLRKDGLKSLVDRQYDSAGRLYRESLPFTGSSASLWNTWSYDFYDRIKSITEPSGKSTSYEYTGLAVKETKDGIATTRTYDATGQVVRIKDPAGDIVYSLRADDQPVTITAPGNTSTSFAYDNYGRQTSISDPSAGTKTYTYNDVPDAQKRYNVTEKDARNKSIISYYDVLGRTAKVTYPEFSTDYTYNAYGELTRENSSSGVVNDYVYDNYGRISSDEETVKSTYKLKKVYTYSGGNLASVAYSNQNGVIGTENYSYTNGHMGEIKLNNSTSIWKLDTQNSLGQPTRVTTGGLQRNFTYDNYGIPMGRKVQTTAGAVIQDFATQFDPSTGNLQARGDHGYNKYESFEYDNLNRLTRIYDLKLTSGWLYSAREEINTESNGKLMAPPLPGAPIKTLKYTMGYNANGNISSKGDVGSFTYATPGKPYAISAVTQTASAIPVRNQNITYASFHAPVSISENNYQATFLYGSAGRRNMMELKKSGQIELTRYYIGGNYEYDQSPVVAKSKEKLYLGGDAYTAPAVYVKQGNGSWQLHYICRDYLGSITQITNSSGSLVQELSYDAWGRLRNASSLTAYTPGSEPELFLGRGYTGHEHLTPFGLINMNARLYDPALGRFLSPDPYVQAPDMTQNYNRYSYCLNNPLKYTDQSGAWFGYDDLVVAGAGFVFGYVGHGISSGNWGWNAVASGGIAAGAAWLGYNTAGMATGAISNATWNQVGALAVNAVANQVMPPMYVPIGDHFGIGISPAFGLGASGLTGGFNVTGTYINGDFSMSAGIGGGDNYWGWNVAAMDTRTGYGGGYGQASYGASEVMGHSFGAQRVGTYTAFFNHNSFSISNDLWGDKGDRWRTNAAELTIGKFSIGTYLYTNDGATASMGPDGKPMLDDSPNCVPPWPVGKNGNAGKSTWRNGRAYFAPAWVGYRNGNQITRMGFSHKIVHNLTQNWVHKGFGKQNYYMFYDEFNTRGYFYSGYNNSLSLWDH